MKKGATKHCSRAAPGVLIAINFVTIISKMINKHVSFTSMDLKVCRSTYPAIEIDDGVVAVLVLK